MHNIVGKRPAEFISCFFVHKKSSLKNLQMNDIMSIVKEVFFISDYDKFNYWIEIAEYDLETAKAMLKTKRFLYVGYMCHQSIEKILKGLYVKNNKLIPPYIHNLRKLIKLTELHNFLSEEQINFINILEPLNIEGRYPAFKEQLYKSLNEGKCCDIIERTEELLKWIRNRL